jgi:hypothetical protein
MCWNKTNKKCRFESVSMEVTAKVAGAIAAREEIAFLTQFQWFQGTKSSRTTEFAIFAMEWLQQGFSWYFICGFF